MKAYPNLQIVISDTGLVRTVTVSDPGMDLRDYFAAHAPVDVYDLDSCFGIYWDELKGKELLDKLAQARYQYADAMMEARNAK